MRSEALPSSLLALSPPGRNNGKKEFDAKYPLNYASKLTLFSHICTALFSGYGRRCTYRVVQSSFSNYKLEPIFCFVAPLRLYFIRPIPRLYAANECLLLRCLSLSALNFLSHHCVAKTRVHFFSRQHDSNVCIGKVSLVSTITMSHICGEKILHA